MLHHYSHILKTIELIRDSFPGSEVVYTQGSCVKLAMVLKHLYPEGNILYDHDHAIFLYDQRCYDINGFAKRTKKHKKLESYGLLESFEIMSLKYEP